MKKIKRWLLPLAAALCLVLAGCGGNAEALSVPSGDVREETGTAEETEFPTLEEESSFEDLESSHSEEESQSGSPDSSTSEEETSAGEEESAAEEISDAASFTSEDVPGYSGSPYVVVHDNIPWFKEEDLTADSYESYSDLDSLGRCGTAMASIGRDLMPTEERGEIGQVRPTGWHTVKYDCVSGRYLYNRCHLIAFELAGENANEKNLITGTRYFNVDGMLPFENLVTDYVKETGNHVLYRVTPVFTGENLVADGVLMEAESVEDDGEGVLFNVFCYNVQPGVEIDYATGDSHEDGTAAETAADDGTAETAAETGRSQGEGQTYILNTNTHKFHYPGCSSVDDMSESNKQSYTGTREEVIAMGYDPCGRCNP